MNWYKTAQKTEVAKDIYDRSLEDSYWKDVSEKYPKYNNDVKQTPLAVLYILSNMIDKYKEDMAKVDDGTFEGVHRLEDLICELYSAIHGGLT